MKIFKDIITSRNNQIVKRVASLHDKKGREREKCFIAEGEKLTYEAIDARLPIESVFILDSRFDSVIQNLSSRMSQPMYEDVEIHVLSDSAFEKISTEKAPQGVISVIKHLDFFYNIDIIYNEDFFLGKGERTIALYSVRDPGNLGSVIRSATAFGVEHIILSGDCADVYNPKTVRSAMGSLFKIKVSVVRSFESFISAARHNGRRVLSAELTPSAKSLKEIDIKGTDIVIIGNEGHGIPETISSMTDGSVYIPISDKTESLNASVAAAIFMWEQNK